MIGSGSTGPAPNTGDNAVDEIFDEKSLLGNVGGVPTSTKRASSFRGGIISNKKIGFQSIYPEGGELDRLAKSSLAAKTYTMEASTPKQFLKNVGFTIELSGTYV